jgi:hypothetical protein
MLNAFQAALYQRLQDFELDDPTHEFGFTRHLMKNHGWTLTYAQRAIAEYKKFAFLTVVANHQVAPSDQVDQVWHAHVLSPKTVRARETFNDRVGSLHGNEFLVILAHHYFAWISIIFTK